MKIKPEAFTECLAKIAERGKINPDEAKQLLQQVADRAEVMRRTGKPDPFVTAASELADQVTAGAARKKADALRNLKIRTDILARLKADPKGINGAVENLRAMLHGTYKTSLDSVQALHRGLTVNWLGPMTYRLKKAGLDKVLISGGMDKDLAIELGVKSGWTKEGSGNKQAAAAAEILHPVMEAVRLKLNSVGAHIESALDYVAKTRHDPAAIRRAAGSYKNTPEQAFQAWWAYTKPRLAEKTFATVTPKEGQTMEQAIDTFGRSTFEALVSGVRMTMGATADDYVPIAYEGTRNLARKLSEDRTLFWKDPVAWHEYVSRFGDQRSVTEGIVRTISQGARQAALMERFGTNPMANLRTIADRLETHYRGTDLDGVVKFKKDYHVVERVTAYMDGSANVPVNSDWARIGQSVRTLYAVWDLGGVGVTHFASIWPTVTSEMRQHGVNRLEAMANLVRELVSRPFNSEAKKEIEGDLGAYADGLSREMSSNWQPDTPLPGKLSSMANTFMHWTGIHYVFDTTQAAVRSMLSHNLARNMGKEFEALEPHLQGMLSAYGIDRPQWNLLRSATDLATENGRAYLTPRDAMAVDPSGVLADKLMGYYSDSAAHSTVTAGARERSISILGDTKAGTAVGETMRFMAQFKMWPIAAYDQLLRREIYMSTSARDAAWGIGSMAALSTAAGYLRIAINNSALGNPVPPVFDMTRDADRTGAAKGLPHGVATLAAALAQGGGMGILGDFFFGEAMRNRMGAGLVGTVGGPLASDADALIKLYSDWTTGANSWPDIARFFVRHIPFANLVYIKGTLDYLAWYHMYEAASPGWWERSNRRMLKERGDTMTGYVPGAGVPWGVPGVYTQTPGGSTTGLFGAH